MSVTFFFLIHKVIVCLCKRDFNFFLAADIGLNSYLDYCEFHSKICNMSKGKIFKLFFAKQNFSKILTQVT